MLGSTSTETYPELENPSNNEKLLSSSLIIRTGGKKSSQIYNSALREAALALAPATLLLALKSGANVNHEDKYGNTPLANAILTYHRRYSGETRSLKSEHTLWRIVNQLIDYGANTNITVCEFFSSASSKPILLSTFIAEQSEVFETKLADRIIAVPV